MKKRALTFVQLGVTVLILGWLFRDSANNRAMWETLTSVSPLWLLASFVSFGIMRTFSLLRWQSLLRVQKISIAWPRLGALTLIGLFFNIFMPGGTGGDIIKSLYLLPEAPGRKAEALLSVLMDRLIGLVAMFVIAAIALYARYDWLMATPVTSGLVYTLIVISLGCLGAVAGACLICALDLGEKLPKKLPLRSKIIDVLAAFKLYGRTWRTSLMALLLSFPMHIFSFAQFYCVARAMGDAAAKVTFIDFLVLMPIIATITSVPISLGGAGVREGLFVNLFGALCGISAAAATIISLIGYLVQVFWGMLGGVIYLFYRPSTSVAAETRSAPRSPIRSEPIEEGGSFVETSEKA